MDETLSLLFEDSNELYWLGLDKVRLLEECLATIPDNKDELLIRVYIGGPGSTQYNQFRSAIDSISWNTNITINIETCNVQEARSLFAQPSDLVSWLLRCHIHFVLGHIHQGMESAKWNMRDLYQSICRLAFHRGFPSGIHLNCPIFTQDKYRYIEAIPNYCNPTMQIVLDKQFDIESIQRFMNSYTEGSGWVVKAPFTTNGSFVKFCNNLDAVLSNINLASRKFGDSIPYVMLQPQMANRKEIRVALYDGKARYIVQLNRYKSVGYKMNMINEHTLMIFAEEAVEALKRSCKSAICDGLVRVDIFQCQSGQLKVNEFESLEAYYNTSSHVDEALMVAELEQYWKIKIVNAIKPLLK